MQASSSASERANSFKSLRNFRGRTVVLVFSNQGLGNLVNTAIILALMAITGQHGPKYSASKHLFLAWLSIDSLSGLAIWSALQSSLPSWPLLDGVSATANTAPVSTSVAPTDCARLEIFDCNRQKQFCPLGFLIRKAMTLSLLIIVCQAAMRISIQAVSLSNASSARLSHPPSIWLLRSLQDTSGIVHVINGVLIENFAQTIQWNRMFGGPLQGQLKSCGGCSMPSSLRSLASCCYGVSLASRRTPTSGSALVCTAPTTLPLCGTTKWGQQANHVSYTFEASKREPA